MLTPQEVEQYIRLTLKQWNAEHVKVSFCPKLGVTRKAWGLYWPNRKKIELSYKILSSFALFEHVFKHELCHALDHSERGTLRKNGRINAHGATFNQWCVKLKIKKGRFIPKNLMS